MATDLADQRRKNRLVLFLQMAHREYLDEGTSPPSWDALVGRASEYGAPFGFAPHNFEELGDWTLRDMLDA